MTDHMSPSELDALARDLADSAARQRMAKGLVRENWGSIVRVGRMLAVRGRMAYDEILETATDPAAMQTATATTETASLFATCPLPCPGSAPRVRTSSAGAR